MIQVPKFQLYFADMYVVKLGANIHEGYQRSPKTLLENWRRWSSLATLNKTFYLSIKYYFLLLLQNKIQPSEQIKISTFIRRRVEVDISTLIFNAFSTLTKKTLKHRRRINVEHENFFMIFRRASKCSYVFNAFLTSKCQCR